MAKQKTHHALIFFLLAMLAVACKRTEKELTTVEFEVVNPVTGKGYPGVPVRIYLQDFGSSLSNMTGSDTETSVLWEGQTDGNGKSTHTFNAYKNSRYGYLEQIDDSYFGVQGKDFSFIKRPSLGSFEKNEHNHFLYEIVPYAEYYVHMKNIDCQGPNDKMRYRSRSLYTKDPGQEFHSWSPSSDLTSGYYEGCYDDVSVLRRNRSDSVIYELEIIRNGVTEIITKKFFRDPNKVDTLKLYY